MKRALLSLYPEAWRRRYGAELEALLEDDPPGPRATLDLIRGALTAHLHPLPGQASEAGARNAITGPLACFICFCFVGAGFAKATEDPSFRHAARVHPLIGTAHDAALVAALVAAACLAVAALPLAWRAVTAAWRSSDRELRGLVSLPPLALGAAAITLGMLALWFDHHRHAPGTVGWAILALCAVVWLGAAAACWAAPRAIMRRLAWDAGKLALPVIGMAGVSACMLAATAAVALYLTALLSSTPELAASGNGPFTILDTTTMIAAQVLAMLALSAMALLSVSRGLRGLRTA